MNKVAFHTLGCKVNFYDTEAIWHLFQQVGYEQVEFTDEADVYVINTCTVTNTGDKKSRQVIRRAIRRNPEATVVVTGCYAQIAPDEVMAIPGVDLVVGNHDRGQIVSLVDKVREERKPYKLVHNLRKVRDFEELDVPDFHERTRASLKIQDGCNNFCSFCIIPYSRGFIRSRKPENVIKQAQRLAQAGYLEIVLTGIHTGGYGADLEGYSLADLLRDLERVQGLHRIRISSIEASEIDDDMIDVLRHSSKVCRHLHIPLQAGDDAVLDRMNRKYAVAAFADTLRKLRVALPELAITSDVIVGFPGETDESFEAGVRFIEQQQFAELHVFPYSKRTGTAAARFKDQVPEKVKEARVERLIELSNQLKREYSLRFMNRPLQVIPEEETAPGMLIGHADNYMRVEFKGSRDLIGQLCDVRIDRVDDDASRGTLVRQLTNYPMFAAMEDELDEPEVALELPLV